MDDVRSPWVQLALCPDTPPALLRELLTQAPDDIAELTHILSAWLAGGAPPSNRELRLHETLHPSKDAWHALRNKVHQKRVQRSIELAEQWALGLSTADRTTFPKHTPRTLLTPDNPAWPRQLQTMPDPPALLYCLGEVSTLSAAQISLVGARRCSADGYRSAQELAQQLAQQGWVITSGLAQGIDSAAHKGCLLAAGRTIAVMATDANNCYPRQHHKLAGDILHANGCLITETPLGQPLARYCFPRRNRLISALSRGVIVVEAAEKSGTITTARHAADQGREVMAVPGSIRNPLVQGCHQLIRDGATLITKVEDVLDCIGLLNKAFNDESVAICPSRSTPLPTDSPQVATLLDAMGYDAAPLERLAVHTGFGAAELAVLLTQLELQKRVTRDTTGRYARC